MIRCISVDADKKSRTATKKLINKISGLHLVQTFGVLDAAVNACLKRGVNILFIYIHDSPLGKDDAILLRNIMEGGVQIIMMSPKIGAAHDSFAINAADFIMLPTTSTRLLKGIVKALKGINHGMDMPKIKRIVSGSKRILQAN